MSARAEVLRRTLEATPNDAEAWHSLALEQAGAEQWDAAIRHFEEAVRLRPQAADYRANLALACGLAGDWARAAEEYRRAVDLRPGHGESLAKLGRALVRCGAMDEGIAWLERAVDASPVADNENALGAALAQAGRSQDAARRFLRAAGLGHEEARENAQKLASVFLEQGALAASQQDWRGARDAFEWAVRLLPGGAEAHFHLGLARSGLGELEEAARSYETAARLRPDYAEAWNNWAHVELALGEAGRALELARKAAAIQPDYWDAHYNLGVILQNQGDEVAAREAFETVLHAAPGYADAWSNLGTLELGANRFAEALVNFERALEARPEHFEARWNRALALLTLGRWTEGWREYGVRLRKKEYQERRFAGRRWNGEELAGRSILVWAEQGLGDTLQFARFIPELEKLGAQVTVESQPRLVPLLAASGFQTVARGAGVRADFEVPLMSLPGILGAKPDALPEPVALTIPPERLTEWAARVPTGGLRVGVVWGAQAANHAGRGRSMALAALEPLSKLEGVRLIAMQQGPQAAEIAGCPWLTQFEETVGDIFDTAALMMQLDLIVTVDTMTAHLAGSLGRPVWTLLPYAADWRWMQTGEPGQAQPTRWYPSMRLFRQKSPGDWPAVVSQVAAALEAMRPG